MKLKIIIFSLLYLLLFSELLVAQKMPQSSLIDSLLTVLKTVEGKERVEALNALAWEYRNISPPQALKYITESISIAENIDFQRGLAYAHRTKASIYWNSGEYGLATENALKGLQLFENLKDSLGIANSYLILGNIYNRQKNIPFSYDYYYKAMLIYIALGEKSREAACLNNLADILTKKENYKQAISFLQRALVINQTYFNRQNKNALVHNFNNLGYLYFKQGMYDSALVVLNRGEKLIEEIGDGSVQLSLLEAFLTSSFIYLAKKDEMKAILYAQKSLEIAQKIGSRPAIKDAYKQLATIYSLQNQIEKAYIFQKKYIELNDSLFTEESATKIAEAQAQYETANKEKKINTLQDEKIAQDIKIKQQKFIEYLLVISFVFVVIIAFIFYRNQQQQKKINQLLASKNQEIDAQKRELERINNTKDKFFSIVAHDLKSPINTLKGFTNILANYSEGMSAEEIKKIATELQQSVNNTLDLTNNLLTWARLQMKSIRYDPVIINLNQEVHKQMILFLPTAQAKENELECMIPETLRVIADEDQLEFILRNLIANALKFTQKGKVQIKAISKNEMVEVSLRDTGIGMSQDFIQHIFDVGYKSTTTGTAGEKGTGLGLPLCREFVEKNGGQIWVESTPNIGSTFYFTLRAVQTDL